MQQLEALILKWGWRAFEARSGPNIGRCSSDAHAELPSFLAERFKLRFFVNDHDLAKDGLHFGDEAKPSGQGSREKDAPVRKGVATPSDPPILSACTL